MSKLSVFFMLLVVGSIVETTVINHKRKYENNEQSIEKYEVNSTFVSFEDDIQSDQSHRKRKARSLSELESPSDQGFINVYIRESCRNDQRYPHRLVRFPYVRYDHRRFPAAGSWVKVSPWMPIYVERASKQTIIYSTSGVYILPGLINRHEQIFSVAQLLAYGYATFLSDGASMEPYFNVAPYAIPTSYYGESMPTFNPEAGGFTDGIHSDTQSYFKPDCPNDYDEGPDDSYQSDNDEPSGYSNEYSNQRDQYYNVELHRTRKRIFPIKTTPLPTTSTTTTTTIISTYTSTTSKETTKSTTHSTHSTSETTHSTTHSTHSTSETTHHTTHSTHSTAHSTHSTTHSTHPTTHSTHATSETTHHTTHSTHSTTHSTHPTCETTHHTTHSTHPTTHSTHATSETTHHTTHSTHPTTHSTHSTTHSTHPTCETTHHTTHSTHPTTHSTHPTSETTHHTTHSTHSTTHSTHPTSETTHHTTHSTHPTTHSTHSTTHSTHSTKHSTHSTTHSTHPTTHSTHSTTHSTHSTTHSTHATSETTHSTTHGTHSTTHSTHSTTHSTHATSETTHSTTHSRHSTTHSTHATSETTHSTTHRAHATTHSTHPTSETTTTLVTIAAKICTKGDTAITFDDLTSLELVPNGYQNINWANAYAYTPVSNTSGFYTATVSSPNVVFNRFGNPMTMTSANGSLFNLYSLAIAAAYNDNLQLRVDGYKSNAVVVSNNYAIQVFMVSYLTFTGYTGLDSVKFATSGGTIDQNVSGIGGGTQFGMDNICLTFT